MPSIGLRTFSNSLLKSNLFNTSSQAFDNCGYYGLILAYIQTLHKVFIPKGTRMFSIQRLVVHAFSLERFTIKAVITIKLKKGKTAIAEPV